MNFWETPEFLKLQAEWKEKLAQNGFEDIEKGRHLKDYDRRTIAFENREAIHDFFRRLDHFLTDHPEISDLHRTILSLYSEGRELRYICWASDRSLSTVKAIIKDYRDLLLGRI